MGNGLNIILLLTSSREAHPFIRISIGLASIALLLKVRNRMWRALANTQAFQRNVLSKPSIRKTNGNRRHSYGIIFDVAKQRKQETRNENVQVAFKIAVLIESPVNGNLRDYNRI